MMKSRRETETEREFQICAAEKLLLVKILFEEVSFKASFEGKEGRAVTDSERKSGIPDLPGITEKQKARPPCCSLLKKGLRKVLSSEEEPQKGRRSEQVQPSTEGQCQWMISVIAEASYFVSFRNSLFYGEPVQLPLRRGLACSALRDLR